jgi:hypothetical protein
MEEQVFTTEERDRVCSHLLGKAGSDRRIVAAALVGGSSGDLPDRWSDLDLTFGVASGITVDEVLKAWTVDLERELGSVQLFDVPYLTTRYRVFLFPGNLQVDLSFTPSSDFGALGPRFRLLFGVAVPRDHFPRPTARDLFGVGIHHAVRGRYSIERGRPWQAEHWIAGVREQALTLACLTRGLDWANARGVDRLPADVLARATDGLVRSLDRTELLRALRASTEILLREGKGADDLAEKVEPRIRSLLSQEKLS